MLFRAKDGGYGAASVSAGSTWEENETASRTVIAVFGRGPAGERNQAYITCPMSAGPPRADLACRQRLGRNVPQADSIPAPSRPQAPS
jgi:hypothetical protein